MADFKTHVSVAAVLSTTLAASAFVMGFATLNEMVLYALAGTLGGLLPDIDADESIAIQLVFRLFGALAAGLVLAIWIERLIHWQLLAAALVCYLLVRFPIQWLFEQLTVHRGVLHSLLANLLFTACAVPLAYHVFSLDAKTAWGIGGFVFFGATIHLVLDELYSIELSGMRVKRSFGTALKLTDWGEPLVSLLFICGCGLGYWLSPSAAEWLPAFTWLPEPEQLSQLLVQTWQELHRFWS